MSNNLLEVNIDYTIDETQQIENVITADTTNSLVRLNDIFAIGNQIREARGEPPALMKTFVGSKDTIRFIIALEEREAQKAGESILLDSRTLEITSSGQVKNLNSLNLKYLKTRTGRHRSGTWAHPLVALKAAAWCDARLEVRILEEFLENRIIEKRIESAQGYRSLSDAYKARAGKWFSKGHLIQFAKAFKTKLNCKDWDSADSETLDKRATLESKLVELLDANILKNYWNVMDAIENLEV